MKVTSKGRITIPKELRVRFGIVAGTQVDFAIVDQTIAIAIQRPKTDGSPDLVNFVDTSVSTD